MEDKYKSCSSVDQPSLHSIANKINDKRKNRDNHFYNQYVNVKNWFVTKKNKYMISATRGPTAVTIIFIIASFFLMIAILIRLLSKINFSSFKICLILALLCWLVYSCFFWAGFAFQIKAKIDKKKLACAYYSLSHNALYGNKGSAEEFIGI